MPRPDDRRHGGDSETPVPDAEPSEKVERPASGGKASPSDGDDAPLSQEDAFHALRRDASSSRGHAESARMSAITDRLLERLQGEDGGLRIGTLALFNDSVRFGGGFHTAGAAEPSPRGDTGGGALDLSPDRIDNHIDHFVRPSDFDRLLQVLLRNRVVVLARPDGSGREAVAVNLLAEAMALHGTAGQGRILQLGPAEEPGSTAWKPPGKGCGLLHRVRGGARGDGVAGAAGDIDTEWVERVREALQEADSYLVVVTGPPQGTLLNTAAHTEVVVAGESGIDPVAIVRRWALGESPGAEQVRELTAGLRAAGALDLLERNPHPRTAVSLAAAVRDGQDLAELVRRLGDPSTRVHEWFATHRSPEEVGFALSAAVLHDARYLIVSDAAVALYHLLTEEREAPPPLRFQESLPTAHPWIVLAEPEDGSPGHPRVRFREPRTQQAVLVHAWNHLDGQRSSLVRWLRQLVTHQDVDVQARACVATAVIAAQDLDHALHRFLEGWAGNTSARSRRAAATVLGVVSEDPDLTDQVWDLLYTWADRPGTAVERRMAATSALVAGGPPGRRDPEAAMEVLLAALGDEGSWDALTHVAEAMASLAGRDRAGHVLGALLDWSRPQDDSALVLKSLLAFCYVAGTAADPGPERAGRGRGRRNAAAPPLLLEQSDQHLAALTELWRRALARKPVQEVALDVLREWVGHAERSPRGHESVLRLLKGVASGGRRHRDRIHYWLGQWAAGSGEGADAAADLRRAV
jgi:hypothetical protein